MAISRTTHLVAWLLTANFAVGSLLTFVSVGDLPHSSLREDRVCLGKQSSGEELPESPPPLEDDSSPLSEESTSSPIDELIALDRSIDLIDLGLGSSHPAEPSILYSLHANNEVLRPPRA